MLTRRSTSLVAALLLALAACGGGDDEGTPAATQAATFTDGEATFVGTGSIAWEVDRVIAAAPGGELTATIVCEGSTPHNLLIEGVAGDEEIVACEGDDEATSTVTIDPGTYTFYCDIPGHRSAGMEGELTIE